MRGGTDINQLHINCTNCTMTDSHKHCQVAVADTQAKNWQRVCLFPRSKDGQSTRKTAPTAVWCNGGYSASNDSFVVGSSAVLRLNFCSKYPPLRKDIKR